MATILFDKMHAAHRLEGEGNFTRQQAETLSEVMHDSLAEGVATKADIDVLSVDLKAMETTLRADMGILKGDLKATETALGADLKAEIVWLEAKVAESKVQIIVWVVGLVTALFVASGVVQHFLH
jgi:hypothetical protein